MGNRNAAEYVIGPDVVTALQWSLIQQNNDALIVIANADITPRTQKFLMELTSGRIEIANMSSIFEEIEQKRNRKSSLENTYKQ